MAEFNSSVNPSWRSISLACARAHSIAAILSEKHALLYLCVYLAKLQCNMLLSFSFSLLIVKFTPFTTMNTVMFCVTPWYRHPHMPTKELLYHPPSLCPFTWPIVFLHPTPLLNYHFNTLPCQFALVFCYFKSQLCHPLIESYFIEHLLPFVACDFTPLPVRII